MSLALKHLEPILDHPGIDIRLHRTTLYNSLFRFDDQILVNTHLWGMSAYQAPLLHLRRVEGGKLFDTYAANLDPIWATATPLDRANRP